MDVAVVPRLLAVPFACAIVGPHRQLHMALRTVARGGQMRVTDRTLENAA